jgi:starch phosphorylase
MWAHVWPGRPEDEVPISHVTNGVHIPSFVSAEISQLYERYLGPEWYLTSRRPEYIERIDEIYDEELWRAHEMSRSRLIRTCRELMLKQYGRRNAPKGVMDNIETVLDPDVLTIGFARRFATYKRADLLLNDVKRFEAILTSTTRPVQIIFAGKAHPKDNEGKEMIRRLIQFASRASIRQKVIFLEDYDMYVARHLVQGADVWLNTPRRPLEACGTSGMKAAVNGVLNLSILDGWWCEGYSEEHGWRIGNGEEYTDAAYQDAIESQALYNVLENDVIPTFYDRKNGSVPTRWIRMMKESMKMAIRGFCSLRMMGEYESRFYLPATKSFEILLENNAREAKRLAEQHERIHGLWKNIRIEAPVREAGEPFHVGESFKVTAAVHLGKLRPDEVEVEMFYGQLKSVDALAASHTEPMTVIKERGNGDYLYACTIKCNTAGRFGFTARVTPRGDDWIKFAPGLITWA